MLRTRRPICYAGIAFAAAILLSHYYSPAVRAAVCILIALYVLHQWNANCQEKTMWTIILVVFLISLLNVSFCDHRLARDPVLKHLGETACMTGIVKDPRYYTDSSGNARIRITVRIQQINRQKVRHSLVQVSVPNDGIGPFERSTSDPSLLPEHTKGEGTIETDPAAASALQRIPPGSIISWRGKPQLPETRRNPNTFDYRMYLKSCGIQATIRTEDLQVNTEGKGIRAKLFLIREHYLQRLEEHTDPGTSGMLRAILFGEKGLLDNDVQELFQKNGTAHILAVSGLHVGMLYGAFTALWNLLSGWCPQLFGYRKGRRFFLCTAVVFFSYMFLADYSPSVVRAVVMVLMHAWAGMNGRRYDLHCAAFAVGIGALLSNPYIIFQSGFQMSFLAILTLGMITPYVHRIWSGVLTGSIAIQIGLGPYILYTFNTLPLIAVLLNVPVILLAGILVPAGIGGMLLPAASGMLPGLPDGLLALYDFGLASLCAVMVRVNELCCIDHVTSLTVASPPLWSIAAFYLGLLVFASEEGRLRILRWKKRRITGLAVLVLLAAVLFGHAADDGFRNLEMIFVDVGQGSCVHLRVPTGQNILIDGGGNKSSKTAEVESGKNEYDVGEKILRPYLLKNGVGKIDLAMVTHLDADHYKGIVSLCKLGMVEKLGLHESLRGEEEAIVKETTMEKSDLVYFRTEETLKADGFNLIILGPIERETSSTASSANTEENENSMVSKVIFTDKHCFKKDEVRSLLVTGDIGENVEADLVSRYGSNEGSMLDCDVLAVPHHGSRYSSSEEFIDAVSPITAVIQVGKNNYGHPADEVIERYKKSGCRVFRNDEQGAVGMLRMNIKTVIME